MSEGKKIENVRARKTGTEYLILLLPKHVLKSLPDPCYMDIEIKDVRDGTSEKTKFKRKKNGL